MAASAATLAELRRDDGAIYRHIDKIGSALIDGVREIAARHGLPLHVQGLPCAFHLSFNEDPPIRDYRDYARHADKQRYEAFTVGLLERGVRAIGRGVWYVSAAHTEEHVEKTLEAIEEAMRDA